MSDVLSRTVLVSQVGQKGEGGTVRREEEACLVREEVAHHVRNEGPRDFRRTPLDKSERRYRSTTIYQ